MRSETAKAVCLTARRARDPSVVTSVRDADTATCHAIGRATPGTIERRQSHAVHSGNLPCLCRSELTARSGCTTGECSEHPFTYRCPSAASSPPLPSGSSRATASTSPPLPSASSRATASTSPPLPSASSRATASTSPPLPSASSRATAFSSRHTGALGRTKRGGPELCNSRPV